VVKGTAELERPVPLYMQVVRQLRAQIASGELAEGGRIPSQREMMAHWRISMQTASKVIGALKTEGLAIASAGRDTIVATGAADRIAAAGTAHAAAEPTTAENLEVKATAAPTAAPPEIAEILGIPAGRRALRRQETRYGNGKPVSMTVTWLPQAVAAMAPRLADAKPLPAGVMAYLAEATGERGVRITEKNAALPADEDTAESLGIATGTPVLVSRARHYTPMGQIIGYAETSTTTGHWQSRTYTLASS
jgi:GntR family transcriptional regulator